MLLLVAVFVDRFSLHSADLSFESQWAKMFTGVLASSVLARPTTLDAVPATVATDGGEPATEVLGLLVVSRTELRDAARGLVTELVDEAEE